jgi:hypothetical protein
VCVPCEHLIWLLDVLKNNFVEVDEAMFHEVERPFKRIFYILRIENSMWTKSRIWLFK